MDSATEAARPRQLVRVWFGNHPIAAYCAEPELAMRYADAMRRRFASLTVTSEPIPPATALPAGQ